MLWFIQNFAKIQNMPSFWRSDYHIRHPSSLIKIWWILLWRTQNPTITGNLWIWGHSPQCGNWHGQWPSICTKYNFITLKVVFRPEARFWESLVFEVKSGLWKRASKQHQETKCNFNMIFDWKWMNMRHLRPYCPQTASELQDEFWVRQSKIRQISIRLLRLLLWWPDL